MVICNNHGCMHVVQVIHGQIRQNFIYLSAMTIKGGCCNCTMQSRDKATRRLSQRRRKHRLGHWGQVPPPPPPPQSFVPIVSPPQKFSSGLIYMGGIRCTLLLLLFRVTSNRSNCPRPPMPPFLLHWSITEIFAQWPSVHPACLSILIHIKSGGTCHNLGGGGGGGGRK